MITLDLTDNAIESIDRETDILPGLTTIEPSEVDPTELLISPLVPNHIGQPELPSNSKENEVHPAFIIVTAVMLFFSVSAIIGSVFFCLNKKQKLR